MSRAADVMRAMRRARRAVSPGDGHKDLLGQPAAPTQWTPYSAAVKSRSTGPAAAEMARGAPKRRRPPHIYDGGHFVGPAHADDVSGRFWRGARWSQLELPRV